MNNRRNTIQRKITLDALKNSKNHPTIEELYADIQKEYPAISKTTVYRNLRTLEEEGIISQVMLPGDITRYEANIVPHHHFKCRHCDSVFDIDIPKADDIKNFLYQKYDFSVEEQYFVFNGLCSNCKEKI